VRRLALAILLLALPLRAGDLDDRVRAAGSDVEALQAIGPRALPALVREYARADEAHRTTLAATFYALGWKSAEVKDALMKDVHTANADLRLQVQWALGRVSDDPAVVDTLADIMQNDPSPLFRDKAACALANDQIHLGEHQKVLLYARVIHALRDPKPQVRAIALQVLQIQTGQSKGYNPGAPPDAREKAVKAWERWLDEYAANW
jgi:hypothetical protein